MLFYDTTHTGELTSRMGSDIQELGLLLGNYFGTGIINLVQTIGSLGVGLSRLFEVAHALHLSIAHGLHRAAPLSHFSDHVL